MSTAQVAPEYHLGWDSGTRTGPARWESLGLDWSAERVLSPAQRRVLAAGAAAVAGLLVLAPRPTLVGLLALVTSAFVVVSAYRVLHLHRGFRAQQHRPAYPALYDEELPTFTVMVALYRESAIVPQLLANLAALRYPSHLLEVLLLVEHDDEETIAACRAHALEGWQVVVVPPGTPRTKPRALNHGLAAASGDLLTIYDAEDRPDPNQLRDAASAFAALPERVAGLQARLEIYNGHHNLLTRWFSGEYATHFGLILEGVAGSRHPMPLGGTSTHFRTAALHTAGGWDAFNVTEDCELGMRLAALGFECRTLDSATHEEAVTDVRAWIRQRSRWIKGFAQTGLVLLRAPWSTARLMGPRAYLASLVIVGGVPVTLLAQVVMWAILWLYAGLRLAGADVAWIEQLFPEPFLSLGMLCLVGGNAVLLVAQACAVYQRGHYRLIRTMLILPVYWLLMSVAAWKAFVQLVTRPHYWEKTTHGHSVADATALGVEMPKRRFVRAPMGPASSNTNSGVLLQPARRDLEGRRVRDGWLLASLGTLTLALIVMAGVSVRHGMTFAFYDAPSHVLVPRRVFDNIDTGLPQLGTHWLPLLHVLQLPLVWIDDAYRSGFAAGVVSAAASLLTGLFTYRLIVLLGNPRASAAMGVGMLALSPSFLYAGVVPMHYTLIAATATANVYYLARWAISGTGSSLVLAGAWLSAAMLTHFDTWILAPLEFLLVAVLSRSRWRNRARTEGTVVLWSMVGGYGAVLFLLMNLAIFHDPFRFLKPFEGTGDVVGTAHGGWAALLDYPRAALALLGGPATTIFVAAVAIFIWRAASSWSRLVALLLLYPVVWYTLQAGTIGSIIEPGDDLRSWRNLRYAIPIVPAFVVLVVAALRRPAYVASVVAIFAGIGTYQVISHQVAAWEDARYDVGEADAVRQAAIWLGERSGTARIYMVTHHSTQDRFELDSGLESRRFVDSNDTGFWRRDANRLPRRVEANVGWLVWLGNAEGKRVRRLIAASGGRSCFGLPHPRRNRPAVRIYTLSDRCPA